MYVFVINAIGGVDIAIFVTEIILLRFPLISINYKLFTRDKNLDPNGISMN